VIPATEFPRFSTLGAVSTPFGIPGQEILVLRESRVFFGNPAKNKVIVRFSPPEGPVTIVDDVTVLPARTEDCGPARCDLPSCAAARA
jgi:hypothetical protein